MQSHPWGRTSFRVAGALRDAVADQFGGSYCRAQCDVRAGGTAAGAALQRLAFGAPFPCACGLLGR